MKIAQIAPLFESVPPKLYGGTERTVSYLTEELVRQGHEVVLFASGDSKTSAKLIPGSQRALRLATNLTVMAYTILQLEQVRRYADEFDILHFHIDGLHFPLVRALDCKTLTTIHGRFDWPGYRDMFAEFNDTPMVSISNSQRPPYPVRWMGTVYHGLPADLYKLSPRSDDYLVFLGRICPEKRPDRAIEIAKRAGLKLKIAAKVDKVDRDYFEQSIRPLLDDPLIEFIGEISDDQKQSFLGGARALLFPIDWPEPFGLVAIEAMACGTPVIAWPEGSMPEVIDPGVTGFLVGSIEDAVASVHQASALDRQSVRRRFEERFTVERMAANYLRMYQHLIKSEFLETKSIQNLPLNFVNA